MQGGLPRRAAHEGAGADAEEVHRRRVPREHDPRQSSRGGARGLLRRGLRNAQKFVRARLPGRVQRRRVPNRGKRRSRRAREEVRESRVVVRVEGRQGRVEKLWKEKAFGRRNVFRKQPPAVHGAVALGRRREVVAHRRVRGCPGFRQTRLQRRVERVGPETELVLCTEPPVRGVRRLWKNKAAGPEDGASAESRGGREHRLHVRRGVSRVAR
mmetsp:Transcript_1494/g.6025  ORF Transcript_1494/g.6025 Transcript_1494/m.6025 type:complete len:213 (-) Transcript_1494:1250-1888(-)